jgi:transcription antitermination factor NusG
MGDEEESRFTSKKNIPNAARRESRLSVRRPIPVRPKPYTSAMPLVRLDVDHFPPDLFELGFVEFPWFVAHTKSRSEKALARRLGTAKIPFFLPLGKRPSRRSGRTFTSFIPFFPGYVFLRGGAENRVAALRSGTVVRFLDVSDQDQLDRELRQIRILQESGASLVAHPYIGPGDAVRIREGPFRDQFGVVVREKGTTRLVVSVSMLRRSIAVELERDIVETDPQRSRPESPASVSSIK